MSELHTREATKVVDKIFDDLRDRAGFDALLDEIGYTVLDEIRKTWIGYVADTLAALDFCAKAAPVEDYDSRRVIASMRDQVSMSTRRSLMDEIIAEEDKKVMGVLRKLAEPE